jgi:hypothetical protein
MIILSFSSRLDLMDLGDLTRSRGSHRHRWTLCHIEVPTKRKVTKCVLVGDAVLRNFGAEHADMKVECFQGIKTEQLHRVIEKGI